METRPPQGCLVSLGSSAFRILILFREVAQSLLVIGALLVVILYGMYLAGLPVPDPLPILPVLGGGLGK